jgi:serine/threonine-protein kinase ATR
VYQVSGVEAALLFKSSQFLGTLTHLEAPSIVSQAQMLEIVLPPAGEIDQYPFYPDSNDSASMLNCKYIIRSPGDALCHVSNVLCMLADISMEAAKSYDATPAFEVYLVWMLDAFLITHDVQKRWRANPSLLQTCPKTDPMSLCAVQALLSNLRGSFSPTLLRKSCAVLSIFCAGVLQDPAELSKKPIQLSICNGILNLAATCKQYDSVRKTVSLHLMPAIQSTMSDKYIYTTLGTDFKVRNVRAFHCFFADRIIDPMRDSQSCVWNNIYHGD